MITRSRRGNLAKMAISKPENFKSNIKETSESVDSGILCPKLTPKDSRRSKSSSKKTKITTESSEQNALSPNEILDAEEEGDCSQYGDDSNWQDKLKWLQSRRDVGLWIQCSRENCKKWRFSDAFHDPVDVPEIWHCSMQLDPVVANCDYPQQKISPEMTKDLIENKYNAGSIVWAHLKGYPWWPAMVDDCPYTFRYYELGKKSPIPIKYNVTYFTEKNVQCSWIPVRDLQPYKTNPTEVFLKRKKMVYRGTSYKDQVLRASVIADEAQKLTLHERLERFSFIARFTAEAQAETAKRSAGAHNRTCPVKLKTNVASGEEVCGNNLETLNENTAQQTIPNEMTAGQTVSTSKIHSEISVDSRKTTESTKETSDNVKPQVARKSTGAHNTASPVELKTSVARREKICGNISEMPNEITAQQSSFTSKMHSQASKQNHKKIERLSEIISKDEIRCIKIISSDVTSGRENGFGDYPPIGVEGKEGIDGFYRVDSDISISNGSIPNEMTAEQTVSTSKIHPQTSVDSRKRTESTKETSDNVKPQVARKSTGAHNTASPVELKTSVARREKICGNISELPNEITAQQSSFTSKMHSQASKQNHKKIERLSEIISEDEIRCIKIISSDVTSGRENGFGDHPPIGVEGKKGIDGFYRVDSDISNPNGSIPNEMTAEQTVSTSKIHPQTSVDSRKRTESTKETSDNVKPQVARKSTGAHNTASPVELKTSVARREKICGNISEMPNEITAQQSSFTSKMHSQASKRNHKKIERLSEIISKDEIRCIKIISSDVTSGRENGFGDYPPIGVEGKKGIDGFYKVDSDISKSNGSILNEMPAEQTVSTSEIYSQTSVDSQKSSESTKETSHNVKREVATKSTGAYKRATPVKLKSVARREELWRDKSTILNENTDHKTTSTSRMYVKTNGKSRKESDRPFEVALNEKVPSIEEIFIDETFTFKNASAFEKNAQISVESEKSIHGFPQVVSDNTKTKRRISKELTGQHTASNSKISLQTSEKIQEEPDRSSEVALNDQSQSTKRRFGDKTSTCKNTSGFREYPQTSAESQKSIFGLPQVVSDNGKIKGSIPNKVTGQQTASLLGIHSQTSEECEEIEVLNGTSDNGRAQDTEKRTNAHNRTCPVKLTTSIPTRKRLCGGSLTILNETPAKQTTLTSRMDSQMSRENQNEIKSSFEVGSNDKSQSINNIFNDATSACQNFSAFRNYLRNGAESQKGIQKSTKLASDNKKISKSIPNEVTACKNLPVFGVDPQISGESQKKTERPFDVGSNDKSQSFGKIFGDVTSAQQNAFGFGKYPQIVAKSQKSNQLFPQVDSDTTKPKRSILNEANDKKTSRISSQTSVETLREIEKLLQMVTNKENLQNKTVSSGKLPMIFSDFDFASNQEISMERKRGMKRSLPVGTKTEPSRITLDDRKRNYSETSVDSQKGVQKFPHVALDTKKPTKKIDFGDGTSSERNHYRSYPQIGSESQNDNERPSLLTPNSKNANPSFLKCLSDNKPADQCGTAISEINMRTGKENQNDLKILFEKVSSPKMRKISCVDESSNQFKSSTSGIYTPTRAGNPKIIEREKPQIVDVNESSKTKISKVSFESPMQFFGSNCETRQGTSVKDQSERSIPVGTATKRVQFTKHVKSPSEAFQPLDARFETIGPKCVWGEQKRKYSQTSVDSQKGVKKFPHVALDNKQPTNKIVSSNGTSSERNNYRSDPQIGSESQNDNERPSLPTPNSKNANPSFLKCLSDNKPADQCGTAISEINMRTGKENQNDLKILFEKVSSPKMRKISCVDESSNQFGSSTSGIYTPTRAGNPKIIEREKPQIVDVNESSKTKISKVSFESPMQFSGSSYKAYPETSFGRQREMKKSIPIEMNTGRPQIKKFNNGEPPVLMYFPRQVSSPSS